MANDEPPKVLSIDEEFAELARDLEKLRGLPQTTPEQKAHLQMVIEAMKQRWIEHVEKIGRQPWRAKIDQAITDAFDGVITESAKIGPMGTVDFRLAPDAIQRHFAPLLGVAISGLQQRLVQRFKAPPAGGSPPKVDGADMAAILATLFTKPKK
jgi:hypothetical protein